MIKLGALLFMLIDHVSIVLDDWFYLRIIGRLSMPLYALALAKGMCYTKSRFKYIIRLSKIAVLSQIPFMLFFDNKLNMVFNWLLSVVLVTLLELKKEKRTFVCDISILVAVFLIIIRCNVEYGLYGTFMFLNFYFYISKNKNYNFLLRNWILIHFIYGLINTKLALFQIFTLPIIIFIDLILKVDKRTSKHTYKLIQNRVFNLLYPIHFVVYYVIRYLLISSR